MTHPAIYAITLGVALGAVIFAYFAAPRYRQENAYSGHGSSWRSESPWPSASKNKSGRETCSICLEVIDKGDGSKLPCHHEFHGKCLAELKKRYSFCPNCRRTF